MTQDILKGKWKELRGKVRQQWGKLTDDDVERINGSFEMLSGRLQQAYGFHKNQAEKAIEEFLERHKSTEKTK